MADIAKCDGQHCERRSQCYRFTAPTGEYVQSWMVPSRDQNGVCLDFWPLKQLPSHRTDSDG